MKLRSFLTQFAFLFGFLLVQGEIAVGNLGFKSIFLMNEKTGDVWVAWPKDGKISWRPVERPDQVEPVRVPHMPTWPPRPLE